jgi:limonene 1,2-monooxygenase
MTQAIDTIVRLLDGETVTEETDWYTLRDAYLHIEPYTQPRPHLAVASLRTPTGALTAGRHNMGLLCAMASGVRDAWRIANEEAAKHGNTLDRRNLRVVGSFHLADTREEARKLVQHGLDDYLEYLNVLRPPAAGASAGPVPIEQVIAARGGVVGTVDDAVEALEKLWDETGGFGTLLLSGTNWMDHDAQKRSYELFMRYVVPKFTGQNRRRDASLQWMKDNAVSFSEIRDQAAEGAMSKSDEKAPVAA